MAFLYVGGVPLKVRAETWQERRIHVGDIRDKSLSGRPAVSRSSTIREWSFRTTQDFASTKAERLKWIKWIEGHGQKWNFDNASHSYSAAGVTNTALGTFTRSAAGGRIGGHIEVASTSVFGVQMDNKLSRKGGWSPTNGWSLLCGRNFIGGETAGAGWRHTALEGAVSFARGASPNPAGVNQYIDGVLNNAANLGRVYSVASTSPYVGLHGYSTAGAGTAMDYDEFLFVPFQMPASWILSIFDTLWDTPVAMPSLPRQWLHGDWFESNDPADGVEVVGYVESVEQRVGQVGGSFQNNLAELSVVFEEW